MQIKDIVAGKNATFKDGKQKTIWTNVGTLFIKDDGKMSIKLNVHINPLAFTNEHGEIWFNVFEKKEKEEIPTKQVENKVTVVSDSTDEKVIAEGKRFAKQWAKMEKDGVPF